MPERAHVTSLEVIEAFRARLIIYREKAARVLDEVDDDVTRTRLWLQSDCRAQWERIIRQRQLDLEQAQQELFSARLSTFSQSQIMQKLAMQKAQRALRDAEEHLQRMKHWHRQFDHQVEPLARQVEKLRHGLSHDLAEATAWLTEMSKTLYEYAGLTPAALKSAPAGHAEPGAAPQLAPGPDSGTGILPVSPDRLEACPTSDGRIRFMAGEHGCEAKATSPEPGSAAVPAASCGEVPPTAHPPGGTPGELAGGDAGATSARQDQAPR